MWDDSAAVANRCAHEAAPGAGAARVTESEEEDVPVPSRERGAVHCPNRSVAGPPHCVPPRSYGGAVVDLRAGRR
eukprot:1251475-Pyramimonas_sp.AAC.1